MPLPIWLIPIALKGAAVVAGTTGVGVAAHGAKKMKDANDTAKAAQSRHERNMARFEKENETTSILLIGLSPFIRFAFCPYW